MRRIRTIAAVAAMLCAFTATAQAAYTPGVYAASARGNNGEVHVEVTFTDDAMSTINVTEHQETPGLGDKAFEALIGRMLETQSAQVDAVAGATVSSDALKTAVAKAMEQASGAQAQLVPTFSPGVYTATRTGHNGALTVTMTVDEDAITDLAVESVESNGIGTAAIEIITREVLDNQSLAVDSVSGATVTSGALIAALTDCAAQTGISLSVLEERPIVYPEKNDAPIEKSADIVIVGAGGAGFAAAAEAVECGASVIIIEKNEYIGGNTARAGGTLNAPDPERQSAIGVEDSVELFMQNTLDAGDNKADPELVRVLCANALDARHWLSDHGTQWTEQVYQTIGGLWPRSMDEKDKVAYNGFIAPLEKTVSEKGGEVLVNCRAEALITDEAGRVTGVQAVDTHNGQVYMLKADCGVILATGGYCASAEMVEQYNGLKDLPTSNAPTSTGDGIRLGLSVGAGLTGMEYIQIHPHGNPVTGGLQSHFAGVIKNSVYVNREGKRFVEESGRRDEISDATIAQTNQVMFSIFDSEGGFYAGVKTLSDLENLKSKGYIYEADTLDSLAEQAGLDAEGLKATIARYNELVAAGEDVDFHKDEVELPIAKAPFYCVPLSPTLHHSMGGLRINTDAQVLREDGSVIDGLYAAGEVTGGLHGANRVGGNALTDCVVFGRIAGWNAAQAQ
ncbi:MAG: flavocytochrome c [Candidatus Ventricola sp.]